MNTLNITDLTKNYANLTAVSQLSLKILPKQSVAFIGPNGAGKSTTMKAIAGLLPIDSGTIEIMGHNVQLEPVKARQNLAYISQDLEIYPHLTALEFLTFIAKIREIPTELASQKIEELLNLCDLIQAQNKLLREYSGGMARKIAIIAALLPNPPLIILDESFVGLDPESTFKIQKYLKKYTNKGGSLLISSHILEQLQAFCNRFFIIHKGKCVADLDQTQLQEKLQNPQHPTLTTLYLTLTEQKHLVDDFNP